MAGNQNEKQRSGGRNLLILFFLISVFAIASYVIFYGFFLRQNQESYGAIYQDAYVSADILDRIIKTNLDLGFLNDRNFLELTKYGEFPIEIGEKGRINPFEPY